MKGTAEPKVSKVSEMLICEFTVFLGLGPNFSREQCRPAWLTVEGTVFYYCPDAATSKCKDRYSEER